MSNERSSTPLRLMVGALLLLVLGANGVSDCPAAEDGYLKGKLHQASYRASAFSHVEKGALAWLAGPGGILRVEVGRGSGERGGREVGSRLITQQGEGWTLILGPETDDTLSAWDGAWRHLAPGAAQLVRIVVESLSEARPEIRPRAAKKWRSTPPQVGPATYRIGSLTKTAAETEQEHSFRSRLSQRGLGRGGIEELVTLQWIRSGTGSSTVLAVQSTRRPGSLEIAKESVQSVEYAVPEAFVPMWPLVDLIKYPDN